jgi:hypothetical protein
MKKLNATAALLLVVPMLASAQNADHQYHGQGYLFIAGGTTGPAGGGGGEGVDNKGIGVGGEFVKAASPFGEFIGSANVYYHFGPSTKNRKLEPFVTGGYTFFYVPGVGPASGGNFGAGANIWLQKHVALRPEIRDTIGGRDISIDYESGGNSYTAPQNVVSFRIGVTFR